MTSLNQIKSNSSVIETSLKESEILKASLDQERSVYLPLADSGSTLFFVISDLSKLNNMYTYSLSGFIRLFTRALKDSDVAGFEPDIRIPELKKTLLRIVFENVSRSLLKEDRLMFALHISHGIHPELFKENVSLQFYVGLNSVFVGPMSLITKLFLVLTTV